MAVYVAGYGVGRLWVESLRIDPANEIAGLRVNQWMAILAIVGGTAYTVWAIPPRRCARPANGLRQGLTGLPILLSGVRHASPQPTWPRSPASPASTLTDEEIERATIQLGDMLDHFADIDALDLADVEPMTQPYPLANVLRDDVVRPVPRPRRGARRRARRPRTAASGCRRSSGRGRREPPNASSRSPPPCAPASVSAVDVVEQHLAAIAAREDEIHAFNLVLADEAARPRAAAIDAAVAAGRRPGPLAGVPVALKDNMCTRGVADDVLVEDPRGLEAAVRRHRRRRGCGPPARSSSARPTSTSSRWARAPRTRRSGRPATRTTPAACPAARAAAARPPSPPGSRALGVRHPTPAARSASRRRCAASSASSRRTVVSAATASSRSPAASTRSARSRTRSPTPRSLLEVIARPRPARLDVDPRAGARLLAGARATASRACASGASPTCRRGADPDVVEPHRAGLRRARRRRRQDRRRRGAGVHATA